MFCVRQPYDQTMFSSGAGNLMATAPLQSQKRRRRESVEQTDDGQQNEAESASPNKRRRGFQLSFLTPPATHNSHQADPFASYKTYQPTPPIDSDSDSSSDRFAARFAVAIQQDDDDDMMMDTAMSQPSAVADLPWTAQEKQRLPQVVIGPPTPVSETGMGRLDVGGDVDMDLRLAGSAGSLSVESVVAGRKKAGAFRMGFRSDCEKCRLRVSGHYSHY